MSTFCEYGLINQLPLKVNVAERTKLRLVTQLPVLKLWRAFSSQCFTMRNSVRYKLQNNNVLLVNIDGPGAGIPSIIMVQNSTMVCPEEYEYNQATKIFASQVLYQLCSWLTIHGKDINYHIIISATNGIGRIGTV